VDIFFVISGFLITSILLKDADGGPFSVKQFYIRRIRRVLPALAIVLVATLGIGACVLLPAEFTQLGEHATAAVLFSSNLALWRESGYFDTVAASKPLLHLWSLGIEEQFYIVWPLLIAGLARWKRFRAALLIVITIASFYYAKHLVHHDATAAFYSPASRAWELSIGGLAAMLVRTKTAEKVPPLLCDVLTAIGICALYVSITTMNETMPFPGKGALLPVLGSVAIVAAGAKGFIGRYILGNKLFVAVGLISYPLYLWHWPLMAYANVLFDHPTPQMMMWIVASSLALATATYVLVERNVRLLPSWRSAAPFVALPAMALIGAFGVAVYLTDGLPVRFPSGIRNVLATAAYKLPPEARFPECWLAPDAPMASISESCGFSNNGKTRIFFWGDSHAATLYSGLKHETGDTYDVAQYTRSSCPPLIGFPGFCGETNRQILKKIREQKPDIVVIDGAWANYGDFIYQFNQAEDFRATLAALKTTGVKKIVTLGPTPFWAPFLPTLVYQEWRLHRAIPDRVKKGDTDLVRKWDADVREAALEAGADFFSVRDLFCNDAGCMTHTETSDSDLIAWDSSHLTMNGAAIVVSKLQSLGMFDIAPQNQRQAPPTSNGMVSASAETN
jgi:peptidoglycan/LPS O-acetylase OafA/YrhL